MDRDKLIQRLRATFLGELSEHVQIFNRELLSLEKGSDAAAAAESLKLLFRTAHSLKGASRAVNAPRLEMLCHSLEELLQGLRDGRRTLTPDVFVSLFAAVDTFEQVGRDFAAATPEPSPAEAAQPIGAVRPPPAVIRPAATPPMAAARPAAPPPDAPAAAPQQESSNRPFVDAEAETETISIPVPSLHTGPPRYTALLPPAEQGPSEPAPARAANAPEVDAIVRVPERKLDNLLARGGELLMARQRFDARTHELGHLQSALGELRAEWRRSRRRERGARATVRHPQVGNGSSTHGKQGRTLGGSGGGLALAMGGPLAMAELVEMPRAVSDAEARAATRIDERLVALERQFDAHCAALNNDIRALERAATAIDDQIRHVRMLPFSTACEPLYRTVRDLCTTQGKQATLVVEGGDGELDRSIVDGLRAPLLHMVRNAIDHGLEPTAERVRRGKPAGGTITISAALRGDQVAVTVRDDGRGIDHAAIKQRLHKLGDDAEGATGDLMRWIFEPGFSTAETVTQVSGRGVGLDVVRSQIESLRGNVSVESEPGEMTCFTLMMPLTVTTLRVLFARAGGEILAVPSASVLSLRRAGPSEIGVLQGREALLGSDAPLPLVSLAEILGSTSPPLAAGQTKVPLIIIGTQQQRVALAVDELLSEQDVVCKPLGKRIRRLRHVSAATLLPDGRIALLLHVGDLLRSVHGRVPSRRAVAFESSVRPQRRRLLLVDDSATIRTLEKSILEAAGYDVMTAADGSVAWQMLQEQSADLVLSDVEMPNMDGFTLAQTIRSSKRFRDLPVILLTSLDSEHDRTRGLESGADAYLVKSAFDQTNLLETIRQLL